MKKQTKLKLTGLIAAAVSAVAVSQSAQAAPSFGAGLSDVEIVNSENIYRAANACAPGARLPFDANIDPVGYQRPDANVPNNILAGDLFIGIANFRAITSVASGLPTWNTIWRV